MISKWLQKLRGGSATESEPATAPEPPSMPSEPSADAAAAEEEVSEPPGDTPA
jgi:hypothetical protein